jgi:hypothetical protein
MVVETDKQVLAREVPAMTLKNKSMKDAAKAIADATKSNVVLGIRGLEQAGVDINAPHDFDIPRGTIRDAVEGIVKTAAAKADVVIIADEGVVQVMSQSQADNVVVTRTYYVEDLIAHLPKILAKQADLGTLGAKEKKTPEGVANYDEVIGYRAPGRPAALIAANEQPRASTNIVEMITSAVRPEIWKINGGKIGEIAVVGNQATVKAPIAVQSVLDGPKVYNPNARPLYVGYDAGTGAARTLP